MSAIDNQDRTVQSDADNGADPLLGEFNYLKKEINAAERHRGKWRKYAQECYDFVAGHQWSDTDLAILQEQNRPAVAFNRTAPLVRAVCGLEVNNRQSVVYLPRQIGVQGVNEMITSAGRWIRDECNAEDEESEAFRDLTIAGEGWTETRMDYDADPMGKIVKERIDSLEMGVNKGAFRANYADARMIYRVREIDPDDLRAMLGLPDTLSDAAMDAKWIDDSVTPADGGRGNKKDYPAKTRAGVSSGREGDKKKVKVVQCQYWKREPVNLVATSSDEEPSKLSDEDFAKFQERANAMNEAAAADPTGQAQPFQFTHARTVKKTFYECFIGMRILDMRPLEMGMFQFSAMTGERDRKNEYFTGMVGDMLDPQRWSNKFLAQTMNIMNSNAKGGIIAETDAFVNQKQATRDWSDPTKIIWVKPGSIAKQKVKDRTPIPLPSGLDQLMMFAISSIRDVTGINLELLGQADREQAASLEQQRRQSAMTILATMFDNLRKYRKRDGRLLLHFIWLLPENTMIRILEQGQYKYIPLMKNGMDIEKFDVIIDQAPTSPDQKQYIWSITAQILQMNVLPPPAIIALLKYSPYPESVVQEIQKALGMDGPTADQLQHQLQQAEEALQMLQGQLQQTSEKADGLEKDREIELLNVQIDAFKAETARLQAQWDARIKMAGQIATAASGEDESGSFEGGMEHLPEFGEQEGQGPVAQPSNLEAKVDALAGMLQQLMQTLSPPPSENVPPPMAPPPAE